MRFLYPEFLYLMLIPAGFLIYLMSTNKSPLERVFAPETLEKLRISGDGLGRVGHNTLLFIAFLLMTLALAQPVIEKGEVLVKRYGADMVIALDLSDSMQARDFFPNRFAFAKQKIEEIMPTLPVGNMGLVGFTSASFIVAPLTHDIEALNFLLRRLEPDRITRRGTSLLSAIKGGAKLLKGSHEKFLLLVTDGGEEEDLAPLINVLQQEHIRPIIWMVATQKGAPVPIDSTHQKSDEIIWSRANQRLQALADACNGLYVEATISQEDEKRIQAYLKEFAKIEQVDEKVVHQRIQLFYYPLALVLLILPFGLYSIGRSRTVNLLLFVMMVGLSERVDAGILDFQLIEKGEEAYKAGNFKESIKAYEALSMHHPKKSEVWLNLGNSYYKSGRYKMALRAYANVVTTDRVVEKAKLYNMANCYVKLGELEKAVALYRKVLALGEDDDAKENLALVLEALQKRREKEKQSSAKEEGKEEKRNEQDGGEASASKENSHQPSRESGRAKQREMSVAEEKKWMRLIEQQPLKSQLYPLTPPEESDDVHPW